MWINSDAQPVQNATGYRLKKEASIQNLDNQPTSASAGDDDIDGLGEWFLKIWKARLPTNKISSPSEVFEGNSEKDWFSNLTPIGLDYLSSTERPLRTFVWRGTEFDWPPDRYASSWRLVYFGEPSIGLCSQRDKWSFIKAFKLSRFGKFVLVVRAWKEWI